MRQISSDTYLRSQIHKGNGLVAYAWPTFATMHSYCPQLPADWSLNYLSSPSPSSLFYFGGIAVRIFDHVRGVHDFHFP